MKKTKLLMPIMAVGATAAAVTPMLVSCGSSSIVIDGNSLYIPTIEQAEDEDGKEETNHNPATIMYAEHMQGNPEVFVQDWLYDASWKARTIKGTQMYLGQPDPSIMLTAKFSDLSCKSYTFENIYPPHEGEDYEGFLVSYKLDATINVDANGSYVVMPAKREEGEEKGFSVEKLSLHFKAEVTNLSFSLEWIRNEEEVSIVGSGWKNCFWSAYRHQAPNWQVKLDVDGYYNGTAESEYYAYSNVHYGWSENNDLPLSDLEKPTKDGYAWATYDALFGSIGYSYHMQNIR